MHSLPIINQVIHLNPALSREPQAALSKQPSNIPLFQEPSETRLSQELAGLLVEAILYMESLFITTWLFAILSQTTFHNSPLRAQISFIQCHDIFHYTYKLP